MDLHYGTMNEILGLIITMCITVCVLTFLVCIFKIMTGDEHDVVIYKKRVKYSIIALILIVLIGEVHAFIMGYFQNGEPDNFDRGQKEETIISKPSPVMSDSEGRRRRLFRWRRRRSRRR